MHHPLTPNGFREYYITSVERRRYLGNAGCFPPYLIALLDPGVQGHKFTVTEASGDDTYTFKIEWQVVRGENERVYSFEGGLAEEWLIIFREADGAYTIQRKAHGPAWTAPYPDIPDSLQQILLRPLDTTTFSYQLFRFDPAGE